MSVSVGVAGAAIGAIAVIALLLHVARQVRREDERFAVARTFGLVVASWGGTRFRGADLTGATFADATLAYTDFRDATLTRVCWRDAHELQLARLTGSILAGRAVRELLVTGRGAKQDWTGCNLRGTDLSEANLSEATLTRADLSEARLQNTDLRGAILTGCTAVGADFTAATLTGACLQAWNIDDTTKLDRVVCGHVFLREEPDARGSRERRPHDPDSDFAPGDFEKLYKKIIETVQILFRNGINREAFRAAFLQLMEAHPGIDESSILSLERKDEDVLVTVKVPEDVDKAAIERELRETYERVRALEGERRTLLTEAAERERQYAQDLLDITHRALTLQPVQVTTVIGENHTVSQSNDKSRKIQIGNIGGDFRAGGQAMSQGDIRGPAMAIEQSMSAPPAAVVTAEQWKADLSTLQDALSQRMGELEDEVWAKLAVVFKRLHGLDVEGRSEQQVTALIEDHLDDDQRTTLKETFAPWLSETGKTTRSILENLAASGIWQLLLGLA